MGEEVSEGSVAEKGADQPLQPEGSVAEKVEDLPLQPVHSDQHTTTRPLHQGEEGGAARVVVGQEDQEEQPPYPSLKDEDEVTMISVEESSQPGPGNSQMAVEASLVNKAWYPEESELVVKRTQ